MPAKIIRSEVDPLGFVWDVTCDTYSCCKSPMPVEYPDQATETFVRECMNCKTRTAQSRSRLPRYA